MEEEKVIKTLQGSYVTGIIGAVIGGVIATIPWVLAYVYGGMMLSILAALIAAGEFYGYKLLKGRINKSLPIIIMIIALIIVTVATLVIIPALLIAKEGIALNLANIQRLYSNKEFSSAITQDFVISFVFTILGASIITSNIKKQLVNNDGTENEIKLDLNNTKEIMKIKKDAIELIKPIFVKYDAIDQEKAMMKEEVLAEIENKNANQSFNYLKNLGIIKKYKGKYYYSEINENKQTDPKKLATWKKVFLIIAILLFAIAIVASILDNTEISNNNYEDGKVSFEIEKDWDIASSSYENQWNFYRYINTLPIVNSQNTISKDDYSSYPAQISVYYDDVDTETIHSIEDIKTNFEKSIENTEEKSDVCNIDVLKTSKNYDLMKVEMVYNDFPEEIVFYYYILNGNELACITVHSYSLKDSETIEKDGDNIVNSFKWM